MTKTVLITGASSGFGLMLGTKLHAEGHRVIGTSRVPDRHSKDVPFPLMVLDIDDDESIDAFTREMRTSVGKLDVLVNNAGYMVTGIAEETPLDLARKQFETNFWGTVKVTRALLPQLRAQRSGQIITVSSIVGLIGPPNLAFYVASKHAIQGYFKSLRFELNQFGIHVSMVEPIWFKTKLGAHSVTANASPLADYDGYRQALAAMTKKSIDEAGPPDEVVEAIVKLMRAKKPKFSNPVGKMTSTMLFLQSYAPSMFENAILKSVRTGT